MEPRRATSQVLANLKANVLPQLTRDYPGLTYGFEGQQADMRDSMASLMVSFVIAMIVIFALLAIPFRSYIQPVIVMAAIPFGLVGAIIGHIIMGYSLSIISMMGLVALASARAAVLSTPFNRRVSAAFVPFCSRPSPRLAGLLR